MRIWAQILSRSDRHLIQLNVNSGDEFHVAISRNKRLNPFDVFNRSKYYRFYDVFFF